MVGDIFWGQFKTFISSLYYEVKLDIILD